MCLPRLAVIPVLVASALACATPPLRGLDGFRRASPGSVGMSSERLERLDRVLDAHVDAGRIPGYQLLVARRGRLVHERIYGWMDREAGRSLAPDTIFRIYSMSKVVTGVAAMIALEQGRFLKDIMLAGDLIADSPGIEALEYRLRLCPAELAAIARVVESVFGDPAHFLLGVGPLRTVAETIMKGIPS